MHIITARTSNVRRLEDHQIIFGLVSFDTDQGQIHVEVTVQPATEAERKLRLGNKLTTKVISTTVHDTLMSSVA